MCCLLEVVVRNLGEKQVVRYVTVSDVVVGVVDPPAVRSIDSLHRCGRKVKIRIVKGLQDAKSSTRSSKSPDERSGRAMEEGEEEK